MNFAIVDWIIVVAYLALSVGIGLMGKRLVGNVSHYLVAGRELGLYVGIATDEFAIRLDVFDLASAVVVCCAHLLANDCDANVFD